jgi:Ca-activated chloride channel family protein
MKNLLQKHLPTAIVLLNLLLPLLTFGQVASDLSGIYSPDDTTIKFNTALDNIFFCPNKKEVYLYIDLKGCSLGKRIPLNISVVFDRSGSMEGDRIYYGRMALDYLIDHLGADDNMSIVTYDHLAEVLHGSEPVGNRKELKDKLHHIQPRGATNISAGLEKGFEEVKSTYDNSKINKVFLLSDGHPNEGITDAYLLERMVKACSTKSNISLSTFGLGHEFDEILMHDLAESGGGHYYYIESPEDASKELGAEIKTLLSVVAKNASLLIDFPSDYLELSRVYGHPHSKFGNTIFIDLKEVHPNETNGILLKFTVKKPLDMPIIFKSELTYDNVISNSRMIQKKINVISPTTNSDSCDMKMDESVLEKVIYFTSNDLLESAISDVDNNNIPAAREKLKKGKSIISGSAQSSGILKNQYKAITEYDEHLDSWHKKHPHEIKKLHKQTRHQNYKLRKLHSQ